MKKDPSKLQLLAAKNAFAAIMYFLLVLVPVEVLVSRYLLKTPADYVSCFFVSIILGLLLHRQLASKLKSQLPQQEKG